MKKISLFAVILVIVAMFAMAGCTSDAAFTGGSNPSNTSDTAE